MDEELKGLIREYLDLYKRQLDQAEVARNRKPMPWRVYWPIIAAIIAMAVLEPVVIKLLGTY